MYVVDSRYNYLPLFIELLVVVNLFIYCQGFFKAYIFREAAANRSSYCGPQ